MIPRTDGAVAHTHQRTVIRTLKRPRRWLGVAVLSAVAALAAARTPAHAQGLNITQPPPDCDLGRRAFDDPFIDGRGITQPRILWHLEFAAGSLALSYVLHRVVRLPWWASTAVTVGVGVVPHIRGGIIQRRYPINPGDWVFDFWDRAVPAAWAANHHDDPKQSRVRSLGTSFEKWLAGYAATACFASP
ncbi:MAG TPA: hypothetical protein VHB25_18220 [Gemmatimonadaceae bacterium]|nr:hypothetical protein [Gemmatimonadaceae bacterium]